MNEGSIRVLVVDDQRLVAEAFAEHLGHETDITLVGVAADDVGAMRAIEERRPHVVLLDYMLPRTEGPEVAAAIRARWPDVQVVMVTGRTDDAARRRSVDAGCAGFVSKDASTAELLAVVRSAAAHVTTGAAVGTGPGRAGAAVGTGPGRADHSTVRDVFGSPRRQVPSVTARELEVLRMLAAGRPTRDIAASLFISYATTRNHIQHILHKLGAHSRLQAVAIATREGLIDRAALDEDPVPGRFRRASADGPSGEAVGTGP